MQGDPIVLWVTALGAIATPVLLAVLSGIGWTIKVRVDRSQQREAEARARLQRQEEELREDRLAVYTEILEPFVMIFTNDEGFLSDKAYRGKTKEQVVEQKIVSVSYRQAGFRMSLFAPDDVVRAYNGLMQFFYAGGDSVDEARVAQMMQLLGGFLLAIRRSVGNESTSLENLEMLEWFLTDVATLRDANQGLAQGA
jgi:hypothetical protein